MRSKGKDAAVLTFLKLELIVSIMTKRNYEKKVLNKILLHNRKKMTWGKIYKKEQDEF